MFLSETGLFCSPFRCYDPLTGRFTQADIIGPTRNYSDPVLRVMIRAGLLKLDNDNNAAGILVRPLNQPYAYVDDNPVSWADPYGLDRYDWCKGKDCPKPDRVCKSLTDFACKKAPQYCCEIEKTQCMSEAYGSDDDLKKTGECMKEYFKCVLDTGK